MTIIGSASVQIRALDKLFEADVKKAVEKIKDVTIKVTADFDDNGVTDKVKKLREEASAQTLTIRAEADTVTAEEDLTRLRDNHNNKPVTMQAQAETTAASSQLKWLSRDRIAWIHPIIDPGSFVTAKNILESLSGVNTLRTLKDALKDLATGFDTASIKALTLTSGVLTLVSSLGWLAAEAFAAGEGIAELIGFAALAPTLIGATATSIVAMHLSWNNFADAMSSDPKKAAKALALLPPAAQAAAKETKKLWEEIKKPVQGAFWEGMGDSLQSTLATMAPALQAGLTGTAQHLGVFTSNFLNSFKKIAENKTLDAMFENLNKGIDNLNRGVGPFTDALNTLGFVGSKYLPQIGNWLSDLAIRFNDFITKAAANGDIERWIEEAKNSMERLWKIGDATIGVFQGLTEAFNRAGAGGLGELVTDMQRMEEIVKGPVFQSQFSQILKGMFAGAELANEGFTTLFKTIGNGSQVFGQVFMMAGGVVKELAEGFAALAGTEDFQVGLVASLSGLRQGLNDLQPSFENMGTVFGGVLEIAGAIARNIAPVLNTATKLIADVITNIKDGFKDVIPVLMNFVDNVIIAFSGPIKLISDTIGNLLSAFSNLPGPVSTALMALGAILLLAPKINSAFDGIRTSMRDAANGARDAKPGYLWLNDVKDWAGNARTNMGRAFSDLKVGMQDSTNWGRAAAADLKAAGSMAGSDFAAGVKKGFGALGFLGSEIAGAVQKSYGQLSGAVSDVFGRVTETVRRATGPLVFVAQQAWADIRSGFMSGFDSLGSVRDGFKNLGTSIQNLAASAKYYAQVAIQSTANAFDTLTQTGRNAYSTLTQTARTAYDGLVSATRSAFDNMVASTRPFQQSFGYLMSDIRDRTIYMETRFRDMGTTMSNAAQTIGSGIRAVGEQAVQGASYLAAATEPITRTISNAATTAVASVSRGVEAVRNTGAAMAANLANNFAPVGAAFDAVRASLREGLDNIRTHIGNIGGAFGNIVRSTEPAVTAIGNVTRAIGSAAGGGLAYAARGLTDALGGPWGVTLAVATTAVALFGQAQADAARNVDTLAGSLDKQTGSVTKATEDNVAKLLTQKEGWFGLGESTLDYAKKLGLSTETFTKAVAGDEGARTEYLKFHDGLNTAIKQGGSALDDFRKANGLTDMSLTELLSTSNAVNDAYEKYKSQLSDAQKRTLDVAEATGTNTVQASILAANYGVLESKTSSASDKFAALKSNLDILNGGQLSAAEASKQYYQTLDSQRTVIDSIKQANNGLVTNLFEVGKGFDMSKQAGRDLHTTLSAQRDSILQLGTAAMDQAIKAGASTADARKAAIDAMGPAIGTLKADLEKMGFAPPIIQAIVDSLGLVPDKVTTALGIEGAEKTRQEIALTSMAAHAYATGNYTAALAALPDDAKAAITETFNLGDAFAKGDYKAILKALDETGPGRDAAVASIIASVGGDKEAFKAHLKAIDETRPGVTSAMTTIGGVQGKTVTILAEDKTTGTLDYIQRTINGITRYVKVTVDTVYNNYAGKAGNIVNPDGNGANGGILSSVTNASSLFAGQFPLQKFANGGIEQHFAQIAPAGAMRLWAEPETGGEAYIPLSLSKRARSKKILEEVARMFGFGLFKMFAEGGIESSRSPVSYAPSNSSAGFNPTGPLVVVNPSAALDEEKVGDIAARRIVFTLQNR